MYDLPVRTVMERKKILIASPEDSVLKIAGLMAKKLISAVMVVKDGRLAGIFTERDVVHRLVAKGLDPGTTRLAEVMTPDPNTVAPNETFGYALLIMHERGFRHVPVTENGAPVGMISARSALDPELEEFESEAQRRKQIRRFA